MAHSRRISRLQRALWAGVRRLISSNFLHLLLHHIVDDADFRNFQRRADLHGVDVPIVDQLVGQLAADAQHLPKLFDGHDVRVFRKHHLIKLSELSFLHRFEPPLSVLKPHFCGDFYLLPLIRIVPAPESHHGVLSLLWCALVAASSISFASALVRKLIRFTAAPLPTKSSILREP